MTYFFVFLLQAVLPIAILLGASWSIYPRLKTQSLLWLSIASFFFGCLLTLNLPNNQTSKLIFICANLVFLLLFSFSQFSRSQKFNQFTHCLLCLMAGNLWAKDPNIQAITNTDVINTDFLLHLSAIVLALLFCLLVDGWLYWLLQKSTPFSKSFSKRTALSRLLLTIFVALLATPMVAELLLSLMKLQVLELTKLRLSFVAKAGNLTLYFNYLSAASLLFASLYFYLRTHLANARQLAEAKDPIATRQTRAQFLISRRLIRWGLICALLVGGSQFYWDKVASQPPRLSEAQKIQLDEKNEVHIPLEQVKDGKLHRFLWIADDGKAVRFFVINRVPEKLSMAVVFDACILCGDQGYVMEGDQVVCVGCGVRLFIPSIGKPGGCNPVPMEGWQQTDSEIIVNKKSLEDGLNFFTTIVEIEVVDPVDGSKLTNTKTEFRYEHEGKTYFFANEQSFNAFRDQPEKFLTRPAEQQGGQ